MASGASVSSYGSGVDEGGMMPAKSDDDPFEDGQGTFESLVLGLAYTVAKTKEETPRWFVVIRLAAEFLQLWLLVVNPDFGWQFDDRNKVFQLVSILNLKDFMGARGYSFYLAIMYIMFIGLLAVVALSAYVGWSVQNNRLDSAWPLRVLRFFSATFCQVLDIAMLNLFLIALDCNYFDQTPLNGNREFPGAVPNCWVSPHLIHAGVAVVSLLIFIPLGLLDALSRMELNPTSRSWLAMNHSKTEIIVFSLKVVATAMCVFVTNYKWLSVGLGVCALLLTISFIRWVPYMHDWVNHARAASFTCVLFCAIVLTFSIYHPGIEWDDADGIRDYRQKLTTILWAGMGPAMCLGALFSYLRLRHFRVTVVGRFARAKPGTKPKYIHKFTDVRQVEIAARCCRHWIDQDTLEPGKVTLAEQIIKAGLVQLPMSMFMIVFHSSFLIEVQSSYQSGYTALQQAKKNKPSLLERYAIFIREQQHTQKAGDVVSFVEMMRNYRMVHRAHKEALLATRAFWQALLHYNVSFHQLATVVKRLDRAVHVAERVYRSVLQRNSSSVKLLRIYTKFLEHVKLDPWSASKWAAEADRLHLIEEDRRNNILSDVKGSEDEEGQPGWAKHMAGVEDGKAVIIMDAQCMIQAANQVAHNVFGYGKNELRGRNINILIPPPFAEHHDTYVKNYIQTGRGQILDKTSEFVALHKERYVFAVMVHVSKVVGMGMDSIFMGVLEPIPTIPGTATAWVLGNGALLSVDSTFTDMFGYHPEDLLGGYISTLMPEHKRLDEMLKEIREENTRFQEQMEAQRAAQYTRRMELALSGKDQGDGQLHGSGTHPSVYDGSDSGVAGQEGPVVVTNAHSARRRPRRSTSAHSIVTGTASHQHSPALPPNHGRASNTTIDSDVLKIGDSPIPHRHKPHGRKHSSSGQVEEAPGTPQSNSRVLMGTRSAVSFAPDPEDQVSAQLPTTSTFKTNNSLATRALDSLVTGLHLLSAAPAPPPPPVTEEAELQETLALGTLDKTWTLGGFHIRHKYADSLEVNLEAKNGGVGTHVFYVLQITRPTESRSDLMLVTDRQGRLQHVTQDLASLLGKSVHGLCNSGNINALEALMPEPFGLMHRSLLATPLPAMVQPHSCRTGAAIMLQGQGMDGPVQMPFKIRGMRKREDQHVVALEQASLREALDDRRLILQVDTSGSIIKVGNAPPHLFGFDAKHLLGRCITSVVDCLAPPGATGQFGQAEDDPQEVAHVMLQLAKRATAQPGVSWRVGVVQPLDPDLDLEALGEIGRTMLEAEKKVTPAVMTVAVHTPAAHGRPSLRQSTTSSLVSLSRSFSIAASAPASPDLLAHKHAQDAQHQDLDSSPFISRPGPSPAPTAEPAVLLPADDQDYGMLYIMGPNTHRQEAQQPALPAPSPAPALEAVEGPLSPLSAAKLVEEEIRSQMQCPVVDGAEPLPSLPAPAPSGAELSLEDAATAAGVTRPPPYKQASGINALALGQSPREAPVPRASSIHKTNNGVVIEIYLWRADMLCGILEVDPAGQIRSTTTHKLNPPGLVLGCPDEALLSQQLASVLPIRGKVTSLFQDPLTKEDGVLPRHKSLLKGAREGAGKMDHVAGPRHRMQVIHAGDQGILELDVQVVRRAPPARNLFLVIHPVNPVTGRPDFREWLDSPDWDVQRSLLPQPLPSAHKPKPPGPLRAISAVSAPRRGGTYGSTKGSLPDPNASLSQAPHRSFTSPMPPTRLGSQMGSQPSPGGIHVPQPPSMMSPMGAGSFQVHAMSMPAVTGPRAGTRISNAAPQAAPQLQGTSSAPSVSDEELKQAMASLHPEMDEDAVTRVTQWILAGHIQDAAGGLPHPPSEDLMSLLSPEVQSMLLSRHSAESNHFHLSPGRGSAPSPHAVDPPSASHSSGAADPIVSALLHHLSVDVTGAGNGAKAGAPVVRQGSKAPQVPAPPPGLPPSYGMRSNGSATGAGFTRMGTQGSAWEGCSRPGGSVFSEAVPQRVLSSTLMEDHEHNSSSEDDDEAALAEQDPQLIEAAAHLEDEAGAPEHNSEQLSDGEGGGRVPGSKVQGDFRRGVRCRKLFKRMSGMAFQRTLKRFKWHSLGVILLLFVVHIGMFALIYSLLGAQETKVNHFSESGHGAAQIAQIATIATDIDIFLSNRTVRGLPGLDTQQDFVEMMDTLKGMIETFKSTHEATYLGYGSTSERLPKDFGLRDIWELNGTVAWEFYDAVNNTTPHQRSRNVTQGLWDTGNDYAEKALWVWQNWGIRANQTSLWGPYINWAAVRYVLYNGVYELLPAYYNSMDGLAQLLIADFKKVNSILLVVMGAEAIGLCAAACMYMYILLRQVSSYRFALYNTFMLVPAGMPRVLAHKPLALDDEDEDEVEVEAGGGILPSASNPEPGESGYKGDTGDRKRDGGGSNSTKVAKPSLSFDAAAKDARSLSMDLNMSTTNKGGLRQLLSNLNATLGGGFVNANAGGKRQLQPSHRTTAWLLWPFALWGIILVALYMAAYQSIANISSPLATLNIVNFVAIRFTRTIFFAQQLAWEQGAAAKAAGRSAMQASIGPLILNYEAMLYGASGVPGQTSAHFTEAKEGLAFVGGQGTDILYKPGTCLRTNQSTCLTPDHPYYQFTVNGLDALMQEYFRSINIMINTTGDEPTLNSEVFRYMWQTHTDILGGLERLVAAYNQHLAGVYTYTLSLHIAAFVLTSILLLAFLVFMWRPFLKETSAETRRVAELLSQLPSEINVDELVTRSVFARQLAMSAAGGASKSFTAMMRSQNSMASFAVRDE